MKPIAVLTTTGTLEEARTIAKALVERKLAACAQISEIESIYRWQGAVQNDREFRVFVKTVDDMYREVEGVIRQLHSYELPAIFSLPVDEAYVPYAEWIAENSAGS
jgi:periplasmic divalent cation tolerance protein